MTALDFSFPPDTLNMVLRLLAATIIGIFLGLESDLQGKPTGMRTLGLVAFAAALVTLATSHDPAIQNNPDALSRVLQGIDQGVLIGVGFLGAGVIMHNDRTKHVGNLTTAAVVWATAAMGLAAAVAPWALIAIGFLILIVLMVGMRRLERCFNLGDNSRRD